MRTGAPSASAIQRLTASLCAVLLALPLVLSLFGFRENRLSVPLSPNATLGEVAATAAAAHRVACHCLNCSSGGDPKRCCCLNTKTTSNQIVICSACDSGQEKLVGIPAIVKSIPPLGDVVQAPHVHPFVSIAPSVRPAPLLSTSPGAPFRPPRLS